jgi:hypothetical protein
MSRRASSSLHPGMILGVLAAIAALFFVGKSFFSKKQPGFGSMPKLAMTEVLENANSLRGNEYVVDGKIDSILGSDESQDGTRVVSVQVDSSGGSEFIGVEIPPELKSLNIEREQRYSFRVKFRQGGIAVANDIRRL